MVSLPPKNIGFQWASQKLSLGFLDDDHTCKLPSEYAKNVLGICHTSRNWGLVIPINSGKYCFSFLFFSFWLSGTLTGHTWALFTLSHMFLILTFMSPDTGIPTCDVSWVTPSSLPPGSFVSSVRPICFLIYTLCFQPQRVCFSLIKGLLNQFTSSPSRFFNNLSFFSCNFSTLF